MYVTCVFGIALRPNPHRQAGGRNVRRLGSLAVFANPFINIVVYFRLLILMRRKLHRIYIDRIRIAHRHSQRRQESRNREPAEHRQPQPVTHRGAIGQQATDGGDEQCDRDDRKGGSPGECEQSFERIHRVTPIWLRTGSAPHGSRTGSTVRLFPPRRAAAFRFLLRRLIERLDQTV